MVVTYPNADFALKTRPTAGAPLPTLKHTSGDCRLNKREWGAGDKDHEIMIDLVREFFLSKFRCKTQCSYYENGYIYDLYSARYDIPIEIGTNSEEKLDWLLLNKRIFCLAILPNRKTPHSWLLLNKTCSTVRKYYSVLHCRPLCLIFISKIRVKKNYRTAEEWIDCCLFPPKNFPLDKNRGEG